MQNELSGDNLSNELKRKPKNVKPSGRPAGTKDGVKRKRGPSKVKVSYGSLLLEGAKVYEYVDSIVKKRALLAYDINDARNLTTAQTEELDIIKSSIFINMEPGSELNEGNILAASEHFDGPVGLYDEYYQGLLEEAGAEHLTNDQCKSLRVNAYALAWLDTLSV